MPRSQRPPTAASLNDPRRLAAVAALQLDDAEQLPVLGRVNELAQQLLGVPISVVSMVTAGKQVHVSQVGLSDDRRSHSESPLSHSLCQHVVTSGEALVIDDASAHPVSIDSRSVDELGIRAYAGVPLALAGGETLGAFCAVDTRPRSWSASDLSALSALRDIASELLDQRRQLLEARLRDPVTGLPRPPLFLRQLAVLQENLAPAEALNLTTMSIDAFGDVDAQHGSEVADAVLNEIASRLTAQVAHQRHPGAVTRVAGATFVTASVVTTTEPPSRRARDLLDAIRQPIATASEPVEVAAQTRTFTTRDVVDAAGLFERATAA